MHIIPLAFHTADDYNEIRAMVMERIHGCLWRYRKFQLYDKDMREEMVISLERSCLNRTIDLADEKHIYKDWTDNGFLNIYARETNRVISHLDDDILDCHTIIMRLLNDELDPNVIAYMTSKELMPEKTAAIEYIINIRNNQKIQGKTSTMYKCPKCGHRESSIRETQLRSLDEGANILAACHNCTFSWVAA